MIAIILAAGMGMRLKPLTNNIPKPLLKIGNCSLLERMILNCIDENIFEFIVVTGFYSDKVDKLCGELEDKYSVKITTVENSNYKNTNTSVSVYLATTFIEKNYVDADFIIINGDNVVDPKIISKISEYYHSALVIDNVKKLNEESFKIIINNGIITDIGKQLDLNESSGEFIGISKVSSDDTSEFNIILNNLIEHDRQNYYDYAFKKLSEKTKLDYIKTNGLKWTEIDDLNDYNYAKQLINELD